MIMPIEMCVVFYGKGQVHRAIFYVSLALANYTNTHLCTLDFFLLLVAILQISPFQLKPVQTNVQLIVSCLCIFW